MYRPSDNVDRALSSSGKKQRQTRNNVLLVDSFGALHVLSDTSEGRCMIHVSQMKQDTPFQQGVFSIKTPDFTELSCLACRSCNRRRSRAMEPSCRRKRRRTGVYHPSVSILNMLSAISSDIGLLTTSSVLVVPNFEIWSWKHVAGCMTSEFG